jgi:F0F1-type ATP synthase membrane subunit b/b'
VNRKTTVSILFFLVFVVSVLAGGEGSSGEQHHFDWGAFLGKVLNSTILFGGLILLLRKPILKLLTEKSLEVKSNIREREVQLRESAETFEEIKRRLEKIEEEVMEMRKRAESIGDEEKRRIEELGKKEAERIMRLGDEEIRSRVEASIRKLKARIADLSIDHFKKEIQAHLDEKTHQKIIEKNIEMSGEIIDKR